MKKVLILGCNAITEFIVPRLTGLATISEIIIASRDKAECDELRKKYSGKGARITTARVDLDNEQGTKMMLSITNPDLIVNLAPAELSLKVMKLALEAGTDYIDGVLYDWENGNLLSKQFEHFAEFRSAGKMAVAGCAMRPALLAALVKNSMRDGFDVVNSADFYEINMTVEEPRDAVSVEEGKIIKKPAKSESIKLDKTFDKFEGNSLYLTDSQVVQDFLTEIPGVPNVKYYVSYEEEVKEDFTPELTKLGMLSEEPIEVFPGVKISPKDFWNLLLESRKTEKVLSGACGAGVVVEGTFRGAAKKEFIYFTGDNDKCMEENGMSSMGLFDAYAMLSGITLICSGRWAKSGVFTPAAFEPDLFINGIKTSGLKIESKAM